MDPPFHNWVSQGGTEGKDQRWWVGDAILSSAYDEKALPGEPLWEEHLIGVGRLEHSQHHNL